MHACVPAASQPGMAIPDRSSVLEDFKWKAQCKSAGVCRVMEPHMLQT